jgi:hypothetical protein
VVARNANETMVALMVGSGGVEFGGSLFVVWSQTVGFVLMYLAEIWLRLL